MTTNERFEIVAEVFHWMTGMTAPGKDTPSHEGESYDQRATRAELFRTWHEKYGECIDAAIRAMEAARGRDDLRDENATLITGMRAALRWPARELDDDIRRGRTEFDHTYDPAYVADYRAIAAAREILDRKESLP